jgi:hypothetical protein
LFRDAEDPRGTPSLCVIIATCLAAQPYARFINTATGLRGVRLVAGFGPRSLGVSDGNADTFAIGIFGVDTVFDLENDAAGPTVTCSVKKSTLPRRT